MKLVIGGRAQGKCALLLAREGLSPADAVSYTHLTLPTKLEV